MNDGAATSHVVADQSEVLDFLAEAKTHGLDAPPKRIDTHGAVVFLAGADVYKVKRAVRFPFMDLSTLAKRKAACEAEIAVNKADAPDIYLGAVPIARDGDALKIGGDGEPVEWAVHMRRFDETMTLDHVAERDGLSPALLAKLVRAILASHDRAPRGEAGPAAESLRQYLKQNRGAFAESPGLFPEERGRALTDRSETLLSDVWDLLIRRGHAGFVRRCHGDLHLRNIVLIEGEPTLFDAVEFDDAIATGDVLYDLAFLLMDLWERGLQREASTVLNRYLWGGEEAHIEGLAALPIFLSIRAAIRSKVTAASLPHLADAEREPAAADARRYFAAAERFIEPSAPRLVAVGGLSGSGKTTVSARIAPLIGKPPGAVHLRSDIERKVLAGVGETERLPPDAYTQEASDAVYAALRRKAEGALAAGYGVIVDAVHARPAERQAVEAVAAAAKAPFTGLWLDAPVETLVDRVGVRKDDASDATGSVVRDQARLDLGDIGWTRIDASGDAAAEALEALGLKP